MRLSYYTLLKVSCDSNRQSYTMFIYLKKKLTFSTIIQDKQNIQTNITCSLHLLIKIYSNVYIF